MNFSVSSVNKNLLFWILLFCIPLIIIVLLEIGLRIVDYGDDLTLFKQAKGEYSEYMYINRWVAKRYFSNQNIPDPTNDVFLKDKPDNGFRIFVLGGSTAAGWPYSNNIMFSRILQKRLTDTFPDKYIEVVNTSISAINSYAFADFTDDILQYEPDLILIYAGHNEYYGALGVGSTQNVGSSAWITNIYIKTVQLKTFQLQRFFIQHISMWLFGESDSGDESTSTLMATMVNEQQIEYGSDLYQKGVSQFETNMSDLISEYKDAGVPVIISDLVSNVRDQAPFKSSDTSLATSAHKVFQKSKKLDQKERYTEAKQYYYQAKDMDVLRFRASEDFNDKIYQIASDYEINIIPMKKYFEESSPHDLIGNNLMLDHLHPNIDGHFIMADAFYQEIINKNLILPISDSGSLKISRNYRSKWGYSILDSVYAHMKIKYLKSGWPFISNNTQPANQTFPINNRIEEIALRIWKDRSYTSEDGHADLAQIYESQGQFENAFHEYNALTCLKPLNNTAYLKASDASIKAGNLQRALPFLEYSLILEKTAFAYKWIGLIYLDKNNFENAIKNLEIVYNLDIKDPEILYNMGLTYYQLEKYKLSKKMLEDLIDFESDDPEVKSMILTLKKLIQKTVQ